MTTALTILILISPFAVAAVLSRAARRSGFLRLHRDQFRMAAPMTGRLFGLDLADDRDVRRMEHDLDAVRTRFERHPAWPSSGAVGERR
jgi:hypothetical protein